MGWHPSACVGLSGSRFTLISRCWLGFRRHSPEHEQYRSRRRLRERTIYRRLKRTPYGAPVSCFVVSGFFPSLNHLRIFAMRPAIGRVYAVSPIVSLDTSVARELLDQLRVAFSALASILEGSRPASALRGRRAVIHDPASPGPLRPLRIRHRANHEITGRHLRLDVIELRLTSLPLPFLTRLRHRLRVAAVGAIDREDCCKSGISRYVCVHTAPAMRGRRRERSAACVRISLNSLATMSTCGGRKRSSIAAGRGRQSRSPSNGSQNVLGVL